MQRRCGLIGTYRCLIVYQLQGVPLLIWRVVSSAVGSSNRPSTIPVCLFVIGFHLLERCHQVFCFCYVLCRCILLRVLSQTSMNKGEVVVGFGVIRGEGEGFLIMLHGFLQPALEEGDPSQSLIDWGKVGVEVSMPVGTYAPLNPAFHAVRMCLQVGKRLQRFLVSIAVACCPCFSASAKLPCE